jgi:hypothetical protein
VCQEVLCLVEEEEEDKRTSAIIIIIIIIIIIPYRQILQKLIVFQLAGKPFAI